jgi:exopolyphosphatase / guanosine-5'-triphosphate,3'-diphosphate pyrophosphatase
VTEATVRTSVLDLGSNSFHVLVADLEGRQLTPVLRQREMLHLGRVVAQHGAIPDGCVAEAVETVAHLSELARRSGADERLAVATAAIRDADNGPDVLSALSEAAGSPVRVLDGLTEARLGYLGVRAAVAIRSEPLLVLDLGGGSLELTVGIGDNVEWATSLPLGASRLSAMVTSDPIKTKQVRAITEAVDTALDPVVDEVRAHAPGTTITVGGTVRALARVAAEQAGVWLPATLNQLRIPTLQLAELREELLALDLAGRTDLPAMKDRRADHIHVAAIVLTRALERLGVATATISDWGLREGLLLDAHGVTTPPSASQLRHQEVERLRRTFAPDDPHLPHVAHLATQLFDGTLELHGLSGTDRELLGHAARLHGIGEALALRRQQEHGAYLVRNGELRGFDPAEIALLTVLVRFHPSRGIDEREPAFASLTDAQAERARRLLGLLQLADALDRAHDQAVERVDAHGRDGQLQLELHGGGLHVTPAELSRRTRWFSQVFDVEVAVSDRGGT